MSLGTRQPQQIKNHRTPGGSSRIWSILYPLANDVKPIGIAIYSTDAKLQYLDMRRKTAFHWQKSRLLLEWGRLPRFEGICYSRNELPGLVSCFEWTAEKSIAAPIVSH